VRAPDLNLSRRPFVNSRPVLRTALLLTVGGLALLGVNLLVYSRYWTGREDSAHRLAEANLRVKNEQRKIRAVEHQLSSIDLAQQNEQVMFLNRRIAERTFGWSQLFDHLAEVLPADVRLDRLSPSAPDEGHAARRDSGAPEGRDGRVLLRVTGEAKNDEALLQLVDGLFSHPAFDAPNLTRESRDKGGLTSFDLTVLYIPGARPAVVPPPAAEATAPMPAKAAATLVTQPPASGATALGGKSGGAAKPRGRTR
jgi:Tfp pilus assembly protein PilN